MAFINDTGTIGIILNSATTNITGDFTLTLLMIVIILFAFMFAFKVPTVWGIMFILPIVIVLSAYSQDFNLLLGVMLIFLGYIFKDIWL